MPRKTLAKKIKTREKLLNQKQSVVSSGISSGLSYTYDATYTKTAISRSVRQSPQSKSDSGVVVHYVASDLRRTFIVSLVAIIFELVIYWWLR